MALTVGNTVRFNFIEGSTYLYIVWKVLSFECNFCSICWVSAMATKINNKAEHMSDIMFVCNQFRKVGPTDVYLAYFIGNENGTSTSVQLGIREYWERFPIKIFEGEHIFSLGL